MWGIQVCSLASDLGVELDEVRERHEKWATPEPISCTMMDVEVGKVAAVRFGVEGIRDGKTVITMEHVNRLTEAAARIGPFRLTAGRAYTASSSRATPASSSTPTSAVRAPITTRAA